MVAFGHARRSGIPGQGILSDLPDGIVVDLRREHRSTSPWIADKNPISPSHIGRSGMRQLNGKAVGCIVAVIRQGPALSTQILK